jgi:hypothetical protein
MRMLLASNCAMSEARVKLRAGLAFICDFCAEKYLWGCAWSLLWALLGRGAV